MTQRSNVNRQGLQGEWYPRNDRRSHFQIARPDLIHKKEVTVTFCMVFLQVYEKESDSHLYSFAHFVFAKFITTRVRPMKEVTVTFSSQSRVASPSSLL